MHSWVIYGLNLVAKPQSEGGVVLDAPFQYKALRSIRVESDLIALLILRLFISRHYFAIQGKGAILFRFIVWEAFHRYWHSIHRWWEQREAGALLNFHMVSDERTPSDYILMSERRDYGSIVVAVLSRSTYRLKFPPSKTNRPTYPTDLNKKKKRRI